MHKRASSSMKDVAVLAGVSLGTVSNVLNRPELVAADTRVRVHDAIAKLGWVRNESARQLRAGRSRHIGLIVMDIANPFYSDLVRGVEEVAARYGYSVLLCNSGGELEREAGHLRLLEQLRVAGFVHTPIGESASSVLPDWSDIPFVLADRAGTRNACTVSVDDFAGGRIAVEHLLDQGHRRIAIVGGNSAIPQVRERREGGSRAILLGSPDAELLTISTPAMDVNSGRVAAENLAMLDYDERPTGVFAINDLVAIGLLQGMVTRGIQVPEHVAIIGYDDIDFAASAAVPLSSVRQPKMELGRRAAELLFSEIAAAEAGEHHAHTHAVFMPDLVVRATSDYRRAPVVL